jgi:hypothetical protein
MNKKICSCCKIEKDITSFYKDSYRKDGYKIYCKICKKNKDYKWDKNNKEKNKNWQKNWLEKNKEYRRKYLKEYENKKRNKCDIFKIKSYVRNRIRNFLKLKGITKNNKTFVIVGCTPEELKRHIENQFIGDMVWANYGKFGWHIDHIIPLDSGNNEEEILKLCHYTNLQPLWWSDNLSKGHKVY